ncbi:MAG: sigma-70 family RNA polymerase sigma factor [Bacteroidales bacterium]|nr:sigma-70 family RNA polymerase sigma factor [Bacteroidales bacterium]
MDGQRDTTQHFAAMLEQHRRMLHLICLRYSSYNLELSRDMMQEVLTALWLRRGGLHADASPMEVTAWVMWQARSVASHERRRRRLTVQLLGSTAELPPSLLTTDGDEDSARQRLTALAEGLDGTDRQLFDLLMAGFSLTEIAETMKTSVSSVHRRYRRLVERMRRLAPSAADSGNPETTDNNNDKINNSEERSKI